MSNSWDVKGIMPYMAPEQFSEFRKAKIPADIYSLGKILYEAICGKLDKKKVPLKTVGLDVPETPLLKMMDSIIRKATDVDPKQRYQSIPELQREIGKALKSLQEEEKKDPQALSAAPYTFVGYGSVWFLYLLPWEAWPYII